MHVGLPYTSRLVPNLPEVQTQQGTSFMHNRKITAVRLRVCHFAFLALPDSESYKNSYLCCVSHAFSVDADADCPD